MQLVKSVEFEESRLEYFIIDTDGTYGILAKYKDSVEYVYDLSDDFEFVYELAVSLVETFTMPEFIQELCEEALFEASFIEFIEEEK